MGFDRNKSKVRDCYLNDLPEDIITKIMDVHKMIIKTIDELLDDSNYDDLKSSRWAMTCIDDFKEKPSGKSQVGSVRSYKKGKNYECMIQLTGHFRNHQYGWIEELLHEFIKNVFMTVRPTVRKKYDMTLKNEGDMGNPDEGFDIYPNKKIAKEIWDSLEDRKTKVITENGEINEELYEDISNETITNNELVVSFEKSFNESTSYKRTFIKFDKLPEGLRNTLKDLTVDIAKEFESSVKKLKMEHKEYNSSNGKNTFTMQEIIKCINNRHKGVPRFKTDIEKDHGSRIYHAKTIIAFVSVSALSALSDEAKDDINKVFKSVKHSLSGKFNKANPGKKLILEEITDKECMCFCVEYDKEYSGKLFDFKQNPFRCFMKESADENDKPEYNTEMTETQAKKTLRTLSSQIIQNGPDKHITQYTANIYANIISKNLLPKWASGYKKLSISLEDYKSPNTLEFKIPKMSQDFVSRFIEGREPMNAFLHRVPEIKIKMSPKIFHSMKHPDDAFNFFKSAIQYYDFRVDKYSKNLMFEAMKLNHNIKHLISTTNLSGLVTYPMQLLFVFDDVDMSNKDTFKLSSEDIKAVNQFIKNIYTRYAAPEKEKKKIIDDVRNLVRELKESCNYDDNIKQISYLPEEVEKYLFGKYDKEIELTQEMFIKEQYDVEAMNNRDSQTKYYSEKFGVKKLKKIPTDLVAYISIETEAIRDANDKLMIASYCLSKIEIVEWYIELLEVGSKKYIVPHTKPYLETVRTQLLACYKKIMDTPIRKNNNDQIVYPKGYEG